MNTIKKDLFLKKHSEIGPNPCSFGEVRSQVTLTVLENFPTKTHHLLPFEQRRFPRIPTPRYPPPTAVSTSHRHVHVEEVALLQRPVVWNAMPEPVNRRRCGEIQQANVSHEDVGWDDYTPKI